MPLQSALDLPCRGDAVPSARAFVREHIGADLHCNQAEGSRDAGDVLDDLILVTSELVSNAIRYATQSVHIEAALYREYVEVAVFDDSLLDPMTRRADDLDESGRGMAIVAALCAQWGIRRQPEAGKAVWARVATR